MSAADLNTDDRVLILAALEERLRTQVRATHIHIQDGITEMRDERAAQALETLSVMRKLRGLNGLVQLNIDRVAGSYPEAFAFIER